MQFTMIRSIILLFQLILGLTVCFAQTTYNTDSRDSTNIYYNSLLQYAQTIDKTLLIDNTIYVEQNFLITDKLPPNINGLRIEYLDRTNLKRKIHQEDGEITLVRIVPLRISNGDFFVNIIPFSTTYSKNQFWYANGGGLSVIYEYSVDLNGLIFKENKWSWI